MACRPKQSRDVGSGFTLLEVVIALAVFAVIGVLSSRIVAGMIETAEKTHERGDALSHMQRAIAIVERDIEQLSRRSIRDELGDPRSPILIGSESLIEFTRQGWQNFLGQPRSELQRVAYVFREDVLVRLFWPVLDRAPDTLPKAQQLLAGVSEAAFVAHDDLGTDHPYWPLPPSTDDNDEKPNLVAIELRLRHDTYGDIERLWLLPAPADFPQEEKPTQPGETPEDEFESDPGGGR